MMTTSHLGDESNSKVNLVVAPAVRELFYRSKNERSGVLPMAMSFPQPLSEPTVAEVTSRCDGGWPT